MENNNNNNHTDEVVSLDYSDDFFKKLAENDLDSSSGSDESCYTSDTWSSTTVSGSDEDLAEMFPPAPIPFWFGYEDRDHLQAIVRCYDMLLKLPEERKQHIRQPKPFIGRVKRTPIDIGNGIFTTLDFVQLYLKSLVAPGLAIPFYKSASLITSWSEAEGLPTFSLPLHNHREVQFWRMKADPNNEKASVILCLPTSYLTRQHTDRRERGWEDDTFLYYVANEEEALNIPVTYAVRADNHQRPRKKSDNSSPLSPWLSSKYYYNTSDMLKIKEADSKKRRLGLTISSD